MKYLTNKKRVSLQNLKTIFNSLKNSLLLALVNKMIQLLRKICKDFIDNWKASKYKEAYKNQQKSILSNKQLIELQKQITILKVIFI
jgi:hypothetical protein